VTKLTKLNKLNKLNMDVTTQPDGIHIDAGASLAQLAVDDTLRTFAGGLLAAALPTATVNPEESLAGALHRADAAFDGPLTALLALDAEVQAVVNGDVRVFPLPGFLSYRAQLPPARFPLSAVRLPPLNPDGHYFFSHPAPGQFVALRLDIHPTLRVTGHVRVAVSGPERSPVRLQAVEHRLERHTLDTALVESALALVALPETSRRALAEILRTLLVKPATNGHKKDPPG